MKNESTSESLKAIANKANGKVGEMAKKSTEIVKKSKKAVYDAVDVNGDGQVDIEDVILLAFKVPGVAVKRDVFLKQELMGKCSRENVDSVVEGRSLYEVIDTEKIDKIAKSIIQNERLKVSGKLRHRPRKIFRLRFRHGSGAYGHGPHEDQRPETDFRQRHPVPEPVLRREKQ